MMGSDVCWMCWSGFMMVCVLGCVWGEGCICMEVLGEGRWCSRTRRARTREKRVDLRLSECIFMCLW